MRRVVLVPMALAVSCFAVDLNSCKSCHGTIVKEYESSYHRRSFTAKDRIFSAVYAMSPEKKECLKCHVPGSKGTPGADEGISCLGCHQIKSVEHGRLSDRNIYEKDEKRFYSAQKESRDKLIKYHEESVWFGLFTKRTGSPYHDIDYRNEIFYNAKVCMGCHSHKNAENGLEICRTDSGEMDEKSNCISCHMPKKPGSATSIRESATHASHSFPGYGHDSAELKKYLKLSMKREEDGFELTISNQTPHSLATHPMRVIELVVNLYKNGKKEKLESVRFFKVLGKDGKPAMPWLADSVLKDNMIKANEERKIRFDKSLQGYDALEAIVGYYRVNPAVAAKLGLDKEKDISEFRILKRKYWKLK